MTRDEQEMIMWLSEYVRSTMRDAANRAAEADCAVEQFRQRYPAEPAADDRLGRAAIAAMEMMISVMGEKIDHADKLGELDRCILTYIGRRWHIEKETGK